MFPFVVSIILGLSACSLVPDESTIVDTNETTQEQQIGYYSDEDINLLVQQFPFLTAGEYSTPSPEGALEQLGINLDTLVQVERRVGDCFDQFVYDLSPSYLLVIDRNACFGLRIWVETKDSSD